MGRSCEQTLNTSPGAPEPPWTGCGSKSGGSGHVAHLTNKWLPVDPESLLYQGSCSLDKWEEGRIVAGVWGYQLLSVTGASLNFSEYTYFMGW